jgi:PIH1 CS-like domain
LSSEKPAKYRLDINLPYDVKEENGSAKFDKAKRQLAITLPVVPEKKLRMTDFQCEDSGIESDQQAMSEKPDERDSNDPPVTEMTEEEVCCDPSHGLKNLLVDFRFKLIRKIIRTYINIYQI